MSGSEQKNHWQKLREQLGLVAPSSDDPSHGLAGRESSPPESQVLEQPLEPEQRDKAAPPETPSGQVELPVAGISDAAVTPPVPDESFTKAPQRAVAKPSSPQAKKASNELHSHWGRLAQSLGLQLDIDLPFVETTSAPAAVSADTTSGDESRDPLAYEVPPVEVADVTSSEQALWQEHRGEFDEPESPGVLAEVQDVETSEEEPSIASEPHVGRRRRRRRRRRPRTSAGDATARESDPLLVDSRADAVPGPGGGGSTRPTALDDHDSDDEGESDRTAGRFKHVKIPTWEQAVGYIIDQNLAQRSRPGSDSRRGRSGRR
ncbi:MAG: hypothetical protein KatS3mg110_0778 [Pirellulaceae bacterium]|nr:MAG: hypothetical protein KatS3mg110_0778 [Pirellulaceae bacterium]